MDAAKEGFPREALGAEGKHPPLTQLSSGAREWSKRDKRQRRRLTTGRSPAPFSGEGPRERSHPL